MNIPDMAYTDWVQLAVSCDNHVAELEKQAKKQTNRRR